MEMVQEPASTLPSLTRALSHTMYLLSALHAVEDDWNFLVRGTSGKNYYVHFSPQRFACDCKEFKKNNSNCKHIYFIIGRVLGDVNLMFAVGMGLAPEELFDSRRNFNLSMELRLLSSLVEKKEREAAKNCRIGEGGDCVICTETMKGDRVWACNQCKQTLHAACVAKWTQMRRENICPLCRNTEADDSDEMEAMLKFETFYNSDGVYYA
jgi:hypothetical protein